MSISIVLADDHPLLLAGNAQFLKSKGYQILATSTNGNDAYNAIIKHQPKLAILDFDMPIQNGIEVAKLCLKNVLEVKIIILTLHKQEAIIKEIGNSLHGYILKDDDVQELENCIKAVVKGKTYISKNLKDNIQLNTQTNAQQELTITEIKILKHIAKNLSSSEIAETLFISKRTVEKHRSNIINKLGLKSSQNALVLWAQKNTEIFNT
tara:strand:+ start:3722 stop:4348 length:627 start_codon:yes stop_codon:yes gene_type:complete